ncbi:MAG: D-tyrosyl-tRNA(Tyr) deacylase [Bacteroidetes bacterium]|nr:D-tyrosyl-tRNA(Tyr) deacylase [Bacteroidota bacterium]
MRAVIQRVSNAKVTIDDVVKGEIKLGYLILLGIETMDDENDVNWLIKKIIGLRVFSDQDGKMNCSIKDVDGNILLVSQFTLHASYKKGNRPGFTKAARPEQAIPLYQNFIQQLELELAKPIACGEFGANMQVSLSNDGPVTIIMDSKNPE